VFCLAVFVVQILAQTTIPCSYQASAGYFYDLSGMKSRSGYQYGGTGTNNIFMVNICSLSNCTASTTAAVCQEKPPGYSFGSVTTINFADGVNGPDGGVTITYSGGTSDDKCAVGRKSSLFISCAKDISPGRITNATGTDSCWVNFYMESDHACPKGRLALESEGTVGEDSKIQITSIISIINLVMLAGVFALVVAILLRRNNYLRIPN